MPDDNRKPSYQKCWNFFPAQYHEDMGAKIKKTKAETVCTHTEDRRKEERHIADLLHMLAQIEKVKTEAQSMKTANDHKTQTTDNAASAVIQKYLEIAMKSSCLGAINMDERTLDQIELYQALKRKKFDKVV